jgi:protein SCO1/2
MTIAAVQPEETFAAMVDAAAGDRDRHGELLELLCEAHPFYARRGTASTVRMRGWILVTLARSALTDDALLFVLEELDTGVDPYLVAAAARALRSYPAPRAAFAPLVMGALENIRYRDERVSFDGYGAYAVGRNGTTPIAELLATLTWLGPHARAVLPGLKALRQVGGVARKYAAQLDAAASALTSGDSADEDCCNLPGGLGAVLSWPLALRRSNDAATQVVFEDQEGNEISFDQLFRGQVSIVVFFYTRCDNPLKCSLTIAKLARVQRRLEERGLLARIQTAAITYDPAFDVAERLRTYGKERGLRFDAGHRMLRTADGLEALRRHFQLGVNFIESLVNRHRVEAYVLDREGRVAASFQRLRWDEEKLVASAVEVLDARDAEPPQVSAPEAAPPARRGMALPMVGTLASLAFAFFPKCAVCWAAYLSMFGIAGLSQVSWSPWLKPAFAALMLLNVASVWLRSRATRRMTGFYLVTAGALALLSTLQFGWKSAAVAGVVLTMAGSVVSAWRQGGASASPVARPQATSDSHTASPR